jgi:RimJ/RimL family protein N-acetyltransferase
MTDMRDIYTTSERLSLFPLSAEDIDLMINRDVAALSAARNAVFPDPFEAPPLFDEDLEVFRNELRDRGDDARFTVWLALLSSSRQAVGGIGCGAPDQDGVALVGYSVYPQFQGNGYATEGMRAVMEWARARYAVRIFRATIPPWNATSLRVADKLGMVRMGTSHDPQVGEIYVYDLEVSSY